MIWSKVKKQHEALLADALRGRLQVHLTEYRTSSFDGGRGWLTLDGDEVVSVQIPSSYDKEFDFDESTMNLGQAIQEFLGLAIDDARASGDPIVRALVFLDRRFGKRSLRAVDPEDLHPFARRLFEIRCRAEGWDPDRMAGCAARLRSGE